MCVCVSPLMKFVCDSSFFVIQLLVLVVLIDCWSSALCLDVTSNSLECWLAGGIYSQKINICTDLETKDQNRYDVGETLLDVTVSSFYIGRDVNC